jgi:hypothetical protein
MTRNALEQAFASTNNSKQMDKVSPDKNCAQEVNETQAHLLGQQSGIFLLSNM